MLDYLQRTAGNRAVNILLQRSTPSQMTGGLRNPGLLLRDDDPTSSTDGGLQAVAGEEPVSLPLPEPVALPLTSEYGPGDYNVPPSNPDTAMAKHDLSLAAMTAGGRVQRDGDDPPPNQASAQSGATIVGPQQAPYQMQVTRTLKLLPPLKLENLHLDFFGDTQVSIGLDSQGTLSGQVAQNLLTAHFFRNWRVPVDTTLAAIYNQNILPKLVPQPGGQVQAEGKITKTFSVTFTIQGVGTNSEDGKSRVWSVTGAGGIITYF